MASLATNVESGVSTEVLDRKHPDYVMYHDVWDQLELLYEGGVRLKTLGQTMLLKRPKELYDVYQERYRRMTYQNLLGNCIGWYLAKMFQREPKVEMKNDDERAASFLQDCDRAGMTFVGFGSALLETMLLYRRAFVLTDLPALDTAAPPATRAEEKARGLDQPYVVMYDPRNAFSWAKDQYGNLEWIVLKTISIRQDRPLEKATRTANWWVYDRQTFRHYAYTEPQDVQKSGTDFFQSTVDGAGKAVTAELVDGPRPHALSGANRVPVRICELPLHLWFSNRAYLHLLEHFQVKNEFAWKLFMANFPQLVIQSDSEITGKTLSETGFLQIAPNDKILWLEPDGKSFEHSQKYLDGERQEIYRDFHLQAQGRASSAAADGASGYSKEMEMAPATDILNALGDRLRAQQQLVLVDYKTAAGMPVDTPETTPDVNGYRFEAKPSLADIEKLQAAEDAGVIDKSETLEKELDTDIALDLVDGKNEETKQKIIDEIAGAPLRKEVKAAAEQAQQQAFEQRFQRADATGVIKSEEQSVV